MTLGDRMYRKGEVLRPEALSQSNYLNVIIFLEDAELITAIKDEKNERKKERSLLCSDRKQGGNGSFASPSFQTAVEFLYN